MTFPIMTLMPIILSGMASLNYFLKVLKFGSIVVMVKVNEHLEGDGASYVKVKCLNHLKLSSSFKYFSALKKKKKKKIQYFQPFPCQTGSRIEVG